MFSNFTTFFYAGIQQRSQHYKWVGVLQRFPCVSLLRGPLHTCCSSPHPDPCPNTKADSPFTGRLLSHLCGLPIKTNTSLLSNNLSLSLQPVSTALTASSLFHTPLSQLPFYSCQLYPVSPLTINLFTLTQSTLHLGPESSPTLTLLLIDWPSYIVSHWCCQLSILVAIFTGYSDS